MTADLIERVQQDAVTRLWVIYSDYSGISHAKIVPLDRLRHVLESGVGFAKANMDFDVMDQQVAEPQFGADTGDFYAVPDPDTYTPLPFASGHARMFSFLQTADGERWPGCPRSALQRVAERYDAAGWRVQAAFEPECFLFQRVGDEFLPADQSPMFSVAGLEQHRNLFDDTMDALAAMGLSVEQVGAEYGPGQYEINLRHTDPLRAADNLVTLKETLHALATRAGYIVSFMPKPYTHLPGCGLHVHLGITSMHGENVMGTGSLSVSGRAFVAGLLEHAPALCGVGAPIANSYKRLLPGSWAPAHVCYGTGNRATLVRIPEGKDIHVEFRAGDNSSNPYVFLAALLAAGLDGVQRELDPGEPVDGDVGHWTNERVRERHLAHLPRTAGEALQSVEADSVVMDALGSVIGPAFLRVKRSELNAYDREVSDWERSAYLQTL